MELGLFTGALLISKAHNLVEEGYGRYAYTKPTGLFGLRAAYLMTKNGGLEIEYAHGWGSTEAPSTATLADAAGDGAQFNIFRGHIIAGLAGSRFVPFGLLGAGFLQASSDRMGSDGDFLLELGLGAKYAVDQFFVPRLDFRLDMTQREGGGFADGIAVHPEFLLGIGIMLNR